MNDVFCRFSSSMAAMGVSRVSGRCIATKCIAISRFRHVCSRFNFTTTATRVLGSSGFCCRSHFNTRIFSSCYFAGVSIVGPSSMGNRHSSITLFVGGGLLVIISIQSASYSAHSGFVRYLNECSPVGVALRGLVCTFLSYLADDSSGAVRSVNCRVARLRRLILRSEIDDSFGLRLLRVGGRLLAVQGCCRRLVSVNSTLRSGRGRVFSSGCLHCVSGFAGGAVHLHSSISVLDKSIIRLRSTCRSCVSVGSGHAVRVFAIIATVFFPLAIVIN